MSEEFETIYDRVENDFDQTEKEKELESWLKDEYEILKSMYN